MMMSSDLLAARSHRIYKYINKKKNKEIKKKGKRQKENSGLLAAGSHRDQPEALLGRRADAK